MVSSLFVLAGRLEAAAPNVFGAEVPWVTYQAEAGTTNGQKVASRLPGEIANDAIGRAAVKLAAPGQFVEWRVLRPANAIVIRFCSPDGAEGCGAESSLSLVVNNQMRQKVVFSSAHAWLYGKEGNPQGNTPSDGPPHAFFDEVHFLLTSALKAGDTVRLIKQASDSGAWVIVDQIDFEMAPPPASLPPGFLSVADFGAIPDDDKDDSAALKACVEKAMAEQKGVWIPAGTFHQTEPLTVDHVKVRGAGIWYTRLTAIGLPPPKKFAGNVGLHLQGSECEASDLAIEGTLVHRSDVKQHGVTGSAESFVLENLWIEHTDTGMWLGPCGKGVIRHCRFRNTYADGCNINGHSHDVLVEHNHSRGNGDDGLALFASSDKRGAEGTCSNVTFRRNTVEAQWWGNGFGLYGGDNIIVEANLVSSANSGSGIFLSTGFGSWPGNGTKTVDNLVIDCGGSAYGQQWGAMQVFLPGKPIEGLLLENNTVVRATYSAIKLVGGGGASASELGATITGNRLEAPGTDGILAISSARGTVKLKANQITGLKPGKAKLLNQAPAAQLKVQN